MSTGGPIANVVWPYHVLPPRTVTPELVPATTGGGRSITAVEQIVSYDAGYWGIDYADIPYASRANKLAWREVAAKLDGRAGTCLVPVYDYGTQDTAPWPLDAQGNFVKSLPSQIYADGTMGPGSSIEVVLSAGAALGAVTLSMSVARGSQFYAGMQFSLGVRLYRIKSVDSQSGGILTDDAGIPLTTDDGTPLVTDVAYGLTIWPPLREAVESGDTVNFSMPVCLCRLKTDTEMRSAGDDYAGRTLARVSFEECINP